MDALEKPVWSEGILLAPQHLQAFERYAEGLISSRIAAITPLDWGVLSMELDAGALAAGQVRLVSFAGILPDGLPVLVGDQEISLPARAIAEALAPSARSLDVYLGVAAVREGVSPFPAKGPGQRERFRAAERKLADATSPDSIQEVRLARANPQILLGDEAAEDHVAIKIAEINRAASGQFALSPRYVPPALRMAAAPRLAAGVREVLAKAIAKQRELAALRQGRALAGEVAGADVQRLLQLVVLSGKIPVLTHLTESDPTPRECFLALVEMAGELGTFAGADPTALPRFSPLDLASSFDPVLERLGALLGGMATPEFAAVPLERRPGGIFLARLGEERLLRGQLLLVVKTELAEAAVVEQFPRLCKLAAAAEIQALVQSASPGLALQVVHRPPPQVPITAGAVYFALQPSGRYWPGVVAGKNLAIYVPPQFDPARSQFELISIP